jgi:hypothetical protein
LSSSTAVSVLYFLLLLLQGQHHLYPSQIMITSSSCQSHSKNDFKSSKAWDDQASLIAACFFWALRRLGEHGFSANHNDCGRLLCIVFLAIITSLQSQWCVRCQAAYALWRDVHNAAYQKQISYIIPMILFAVTWHASWCPLSTSMTLASLPYLSLLSITWTSLPRSLFFHLWPRNKSTKDVTAIHRIVTVHQHACEHILEWRLSVAI